MELKTLKDILSLPVDNEKTYLDFIKHSPEAYRLFFMLRAEAIKWIKVLQKKNDAHTIKERVDCYHTKDETESVICFIKEFFNITKEDLNGTNI